jgi:hypothetical protein
VTSWRFQKKQGTLSLKSLYTKLLCGAIAGVIGTSIIFPFDCIKTRLQNDSKNQYKGMMDCGAQVVKHQGLRGFYRGLAPNLVGKNDLSRYYTRKSNQIGCK